MKIILTLSEYIPDLGERTLTCNAEIPTFIGDAQTAARFVIGCEKTFREMVEKQVRGGSEKTFREMVEKQVRGGSEKTFRERAEKQVRGGTVKPNGQITL